MQQSKQNRILYLDVMRAFAVFMMIQGHTVDTFLSDSVRSSESFFYIVWYNMRGFTAPVFMFTAGVVFTYLMKIEKYKFSENPRIKKGIKRGSMLIGLGYLLRYPTERFFDFRYVTHEKWSTFFAVDALQLIGFGLLFIIFFVFVSKSFKFKFTTIIFYTILFLFFGTPILKPVDFTKYLPEYFAAYLNNNTGSPFPFFPWLIYIFSGSLLGYYLRKHETIYKKKLFGYKLMSFGLSMTAMFYIISYIHDNYFNGNSIWLSSFSIIFLRLGFVILLNGIMSLIARKTKSIPNIIIHAGRHTLILYIVHLIMLYGSAWSLGLNYLYGKSFNTKETILATVIMLSLMMLLVVVIEKIKSIRITNLVTDNI